MKTTRLLLVACLVALSLASCKKDGDDHLNNIITTDLGTFSVNQSMYYRLSSPATTPKLYRWRVIFFGPDVTVGVDSTDASKNAFGGFGSLVACDLFTSHDGSDFPLHQYTLNQFPQQPVDSSLDRCVVYLNHDFDQDTGGVAYLQDNITGGTVTFVNLGGTVNVKYNLTVNRTGNIQGSYLGNLHPRP